MPSPEKTRKPNEKPRQAIRRVRRKTKRELLLSAKVLSQARVAMARELIALSTFDDTDDDLGAGDDVVDALIADERFERDIACA